MAAQKEFPEPETYLFPPSAGIPNHPFWPVLLYRGAWEEKAGLADAIEEAFVGNGWGGCWRWGVYDYHHFHSNAHEALGVARGEAAIRLGGPDGKTVQVHAGDLIVLPAGTEHRKESASADFQVVGAYPRGQEDYDTRRADPDTLEEVKANVRSVPAPQSDPAFGPNGPLMDLWTSDQKASETRRG